ncbi:MAG: TolC family protein [Bryobacteraceae bacterium]
MTIPSRVAVGLAVFSSCLYAAQAPSPSQNQPAPTATVPAPPPPAPGAKKLTLPEAEQLALKNNPQIAEGQFQVRAYQEVTREFRSAYYPTIQGDLTAVGADSGSRLAAGALNNPVIYNRVGMGVVMNELITDFGRTGSLVQSASLSARAQEQALNLTKADLLLRTDGAYLAVLRTRALRGVAQETVRTRQDVVDQVTALFQSKLKSSLDVSFANVNLADAKVLLSDAENDLRSAEAQLARLLAVPSDTRFDLAEPPGGSALPADPGALAQQALQKRPDLLERRLEVESAQQFARAEQMLSRPTVGLQGAAGYVPTGDAQVPGTYGAVGVNVRLPVFNGGLFRARRFEAQSRALAAQKGEQDLELEIQRDVRTAWLNAKNAFEKLDLTQQLLNQAKMALDLAQARYKLGLSPIVELSQSQLQYTSAELARARAQYDYVAQLSLLNYQTGLVP